MVTGTIKDPLIPAVVYQPLQDRQIRILKLLPGKRHEDIRCELELFDLPPLNESYKQHATRSRTFEAISYVWGDANDRRALEVGSIATSVTRNLFNALCCFRQESGARYVWADALCINQMDLSERARQVLLMVDIYQQCTKCLVWLGEEAASMHSTASVRSSTLETAGRLLQAMHPNRRLDTSCDESVITPDAIVSVLNVLDRPWWKRIWTIQEFLLPYRSSRKVSVFMGSTEMDFDVFLTAASGWWSFESRIAAVAEQTGNLWWVAAMKAAMAYPLRLSDLHAHLGRYTFAPQVGPALEMDEGPRTAYTHLATIAGHECTDLRDLVYGLLGLFDQTPLITSSPNYTESVYKCFCIATRGLIANTSRPDYLTLTNSPRHLSEGLPSWAIAYRKEIFYSLNILSSAKHGWACDGNWEFEKDLFYDVLAVKMYAFSRVKHVLPIARWGSSRCDLLQMCKDWLRIIDNQSDCVLDFLHVIGLNEISDRWDLGDIELCVDELRGALCLSKFSIDFHKAQASVDKGKSQGVQSPNFYAEKLERDYKQLGTSHLAFIVLDDGRIAMAYDHVEVGDLAALVQGAAMPVLLRPALEGRKLESGYLTSSQSYQFVSSCFCNRPMDKRPNDTPRDYNWWNVTYYKDTSSWRYEVDWTNCDLV